MWQRLRPFFAGLALAAPASAQQVWHVPDDFSTIQAGIDGAANGDTVIVRDGTYFENINFNGKAITLKSENGPFATTIDGNQKASVVTFDNGESHTSVFEGFKVVQGRARAGAGARISRSSPLIKDCIFSDNHADNYAGGMLADAASPTVTNCTFSNNYAYNGDGAGIVLISGSTSTLSNCTFSNNVSSFTGGGMSIESSMPTLNNCTFEDNVGNYSGGGLGLYFSSGTEINNCSFINNFSQNAGGIYCWNTSLTLNNCTLTKNTAAQVGGGLWFRNSDPTLTNCIVWDNHANSDPEIWSNTTNPTITYSDIKGGWSGSGNIDANPLFVDPLNGDFRLQPGSPCIDTGDPSYPLDPDGTRADMGAFFFDTRPTLTTSVLVSGAIASAKISNATPDDWVIFAWSFAGGGPTNTPYGIASITPPYAELQMKSDSRGVAKIIRRIPSRLSGITLWMQGADMSSARLTNALERIIW